ncbi:uncharacterized protein LOC132196887 [Neocloeon triangulifer]|uniref:uncharacterized protein LOC132196887 n=1 Tax=Neocloeon triangulifer TaxID=2078957 RepID=UPI00286F4424|nr:uncharacterized protein LOC132196887 [Neocloeon triangulifer]
MLIPGASCVQEEDVDTREYVVISDTPRSSTGQPAQKGDRENSLFSPQSMQHQGFSLKNRGASMLLWALLAASAVLTWHSYMLGERLDNLVKVVSRLHGALQPMHEAQKRLAEKDEEIEQKVKEEIAARKNSTQIAQGMMSDAERLLQIALERIERISGAAKISEDTKKLVKDALKNITYDAKTLYTHDEAEVQKMLEMEQEDSNLINYVRRKMWVTPSPRTVPYNLRSPGKMDRSEGQLPAFLDIFENSTGKYFIECGAFDGEEISNTLDLEERYNWTGALIEASPPNFESLLTRNRKSILIPACLSLEKKPTKVKFLHKGTVGKIFNSSEHGGKEPSLNQNEKMIEVLCMPFFTIYKALDRQEVDLFVLDIEGHENEVLHTIPFDKTNILVLIAEFSHGVKFSKDHMKEYMLKQDYRLYEGTKQNYWPKENFMFIKKGCKYDKKHP